MTQSAVLDRMETVACAIEFLVRVIDEDMRSPDDALDAACALAELFEPNAIVGYTTIDSRSRVATFQTAIYPRLPTWPFRVHGVPIKRPYVGTCAQAICEGRTITCSNITTEKGFDPSWRAACTELGLRSVQSAPVFGFDGRPLGTFVTASRRSLHSFDHRMTDFGVYALRTILQKQLQLADRLDALEAKPTDRSRISMNDRHEVRYWIETLGCSKDELAAVVARVGNSPDAVRRELSRAWGYGTFR